VNYVGTGSGAGVLALQNGLIDFAGSDFPSNETFFKLVLASFENEKSSLPSVNIVLGSEQRLQAVSTSCGFGGQRL